MISFCPKEAEQMIALIGMDDDLYVENGMTAMRILLLRPAVEGTIKSRRPAAAGGPVKLEKIKKFVPTH